MTRTADSVFREVMAMAPTERALLIEKLIASLEPPGDDDADVEIAWQEECARRLREIHDGTVQTIPWEVVHERMKKATRDPD